MATIRYGSVVKDKLTKVLVEAFTSLGYFAALTAYREHSFQHRTYNLHDSYGSAVFVNGKLVRDSIKFVNRSRSKKKDTHSHSIGGAKTGREALIRFFENTHIGRSNNYITIVVAAAMWYAENVESKGFTVLNENTVKNYIAQNYQKSITPILQKYGMDEFAPVVKKWLGIDEVYYYDL